MPTFYLPQPHRDRIFSKCHQVLWEDSLALYLCGLFLNCANTVILQPAVWSTWNRTDGCMILPRLKSPRRTTSHTHNCSCANHETALGGCGTVCKLFSSSANQVEIYCKNTTKLEETTYQCACQVGNLLWSVFSSISWRTPTQYSITRYIFSFSGLYMTSTNSITFLCLRLFKSWISLKQIAVY